MRNDKVKAKVTVMEGANFDDVDVLLSYAINGNVKRGRNGNGMTVFTFYVWTHFIKELMVYASKKTYVDFE